MPGPTKQYHDKQTIKKSWYGNQETHQKVRN